MPDDDTDDNDKQSATKQKIAERALPEAPDEFGEETDTGKLTGVAAW